ncbi:MAG: U32 family peptidase [Clostridia bacterium]|nr:U32 family peptidase [Clostridia bacterium]
MRRKTDLPELLAPAGDIDALCAAALAGADAVYIGGEAYGARAYAKNFTNEEIKYAVRLCHERGVRLFVTVNTLIYDRELDAAYEYCELLHSLGVDAVIVCDLGFISRLRKGLPDLELHASTQMGVHNTAGADFAYALGCPRVVVARECSLRDIVRICEGSRAELEVFVHGALCVCHSGQCLFSSMVGGRSGNRGECAQPCRLPYNGKYPLSLKDLSLCMHIPELIDAGVASLKIEGRMKSAAYVFGVVSVFRRLLDERRSATGAELEYLEGLFSRGGFTDGYFTERLSSMTGIRSESDKRSTREARTEDIKLDRLPVRMLAGFEYGVPSTLEIALNVNSRLFRTSREVVCHAVGAAPDRARSQPLTAEGVESRLGKLGGTDYIADAVSVSVDEGINLSPGCINELRRGGVEALGSALNRPLFEILDIKASCAEALKASPIGLPTVSGAEIPKASPVGLPTASCAEALKASPIGLPTVSGADLGKSFNIASIFREESYLSPEVRAACEGYFDCVFLPLSAFKSAEALGDISRLGVIFPPVITEREWEAVRGELSSVRALGVDMALVGNIGHIVLASELGFSVLGDIGLNIANTASMNFLRSMGFTEGVLSPELTLPQVRDIGSCVTVLGRIPLMITERCATKACEGCDACGDFSLVDRLGESFPVLREPPHRSRIFNSRPTFMLDRESELSGAGVSMRHFIFCEGAREVLKLIACAKEGRAPDFPIRRLGKRPLTGKN